jgi:hypothetical protein
MPKTIQYTCNTPSRVSQKYIGLHNISFETWKGIAQPYQNLQGKQYSTLLGVFNKYHGLNYFGLNYQKGVVHV